MVRTRLDAPRIRVEEREGRRHWCLKLEGLTSGGDRMTGMQCSSVEYRVHGHRGGCEPLPLYNQRRCEDVVYDMLPVRVNLERRGLRGAFLCARDDERSDRGTGRTTGVVQKIALCPT